MYESGIYAVRPLTISSFSRLFSYREPTDNNYCNPTFA